MGGGSDMIIGRRGDSIMGRVLDRAFDIQSDFGAIEIVTERIAWIHRRETLQSIRGHVVHRLKALSITVGQQAGDRLIFAVHVERGYVGVGVADAQT